jgi:hypothetical protein
MRSLICSRAETERPDQPAAYIAHREAMSRSSRQAAAGYDAMHLVYAALNKTGGDSNGDVLIEAMKGMKWESPRGPISIDPKTRDIVQNEYPQGQTSSRGPPPSWRAASVTIAATGKSVRYWPCWDLPYLASNHAYHKEAPELPGALSFSPGNDATQC